MKTLLILVNLFLTLTIQAQIQKSKFLTSGAFRLRNFYNNDEIYKTFEIGFTNKTGYFLTKSIVLGVKSNYTWTHKKTKRFAALQQGNSQYYEKGLFNGREYAVGIFADKYYKLGKNIYITVGIYGQYYNYKEVEEGDYFDQNDIYAGISYKTTGSRYKIANFGITNSLVYFLNKRFGINCLLSTLDFTVNKTTLKGLGFDFKIPIMDLGIQYHFPK